MIADFAFLFWLDNLDTDVALLVVGSAVVVAFLIFYWIKSLRRKLRRRRHRRHRSH